MAYLHTNRSFDQILSDLESHQNFLPSWRGALFWALECWSLPSQLRLRSIFPFLTCSDHCTFSQIFFLLPRSDHCQYCPLCRDEQDLKSQELNIIRTRARRKSAFASKSEQSKGNSFSAHSVHFWCFMTCFDLLTEP